MSKTHLSFQTVFCILFTLLGFCQFLWANTSYYQHTNSTRSEHSLSAEILSTSQHNQIEAKYFYNDFTQKAHIFLGSYGEKNYHYIAAPEIYKQTSFDIFKNNLSSTLALGRKISYQNELDREFNLGFENPFFTSDYLQYTPQGLIGLHTETGNQNFKFGLNYYPFFLPNQGPLLKEENGEIVGPTPWITQAPKSFVSNGERRRIHFELEDDDYSQIISKSGYALYFKTEKTPSLPLQWQAAYSHSPINEIVLSRTIQADLDLNSLVHVYPTVRYSDKISSDLVYQKENFQAFISYLSDSPKNYVEPDRRTVQFLSRIEGVGTGLSFNFNYAQGRQMILGASYAKFNGGEIKDIDSDGLENDFTLTRSRLLFQEPFKIQAQIETFLIQNRPVVMQMNWLYDQTQSGSLLSFKAHHQFLEKMTVMMGFDILGVTEVTAKNENSFLVQHRSDDRLLGGLQYVF